MKKIVTWTILSLTVIFIGCNKDTSETEILTVASETRTCYMVDEMTCYVVKHGNSSEWTLFYDYIHNFDYETGYEYIIKVKKERIEYKETPEDARAFRYTLIEIISKEKKDSDIQFRCLN